MNTKKVTKERTCTKEKKSDPLTLMTRRRRRSKECLRTIEIGDETRKGREGKELKTLSSSRPLKADIDRFTLCDTQGER